MKPCIKCGAYLEASLFYKHPRMTDGRLNKCKSCCCRDATDARNARIDYWREYDRNRPRRSAKTDWGKVFPKTEHAHAKVAYAIRRGILKKNPCIKCGAEKAMAHHEDYDKPLDVVWLCPVHHRARHSEIRRLGLDMHLAER